MEGQERRVWCPAEQRRELVIALVSDNLEAIRALCRKYRIARLDLFGSAATGKFNPATSDLDFLVDLGKFVSESPWRLVDFGLDLELLLHREVDLVTINSLKNPYFIASVNHTKAMLYPELSYKDRSSSCRAKSRHLSDDQPSGERSLDKLEMTLSVQM